MRHFHQLRCSLIHYRKRLSVKDEMTNIEIEKPSLVYFFHWSIVPIYPVRIERVQEKNKSKKISSYGPGSIRMIECLKGCTKMSRTRLIKACSPKGRWTARAPGLGAKSRWWDGILVWCLPGRIRRVLGSIF